MQKLTIIEAGAKALKKVPYRAYQVSYRIADKRTADGTAEERYDALIAKLETLPAVVSRGHFSDAAHISTSTWLVRTSDPNEDALGRKLSRGLTQGEDLLDVMRVAPAARFELTVKAPRQKRK